MSVDLIPDAYTWISYFLIVIIIVSGIVAATVVYGGFFKRVMR